MADLESQVKIEESILLKLALFKANEAHPDRIYHFLKCKQSMCLLALLHQQDTCAILPTGYGKSVIFELAPLLLSNKCSTSGSSSNLQKADSCVIVLAPLNSIINEQLNMK